MSNHEQINTTFRRVEASEELMAYIRREGEQLRAQHPGLRAVNATLEQIGGRKRKNRLFGARLVLALPGGRLVAKARAEDPHDALERAFSTIERFRETARASSASQSPALASSPAPLHA